MIILEKSADNSKNDGIHNLPVEILEEIFSHVGEKDLVALAYVSVRWNNICQRVARCRCAEKIPQDILTELLSEQEWGFVDWVEVWRDWVGSQIKAGVDYEETGCPRMVRLPQEVTATAIDGSFVYSGTDDGTLEVRDISRKNFVIRSRIDDGKVHSIGLVKSFDLVPVACETYLHFFSINFFARTWDKLHPDFSLILGQNKLVSVFGPRFCASDNEKTLHVYETFYVGQTVRTDKICEIKQAMSWVQWKLWR